MISERIVISLGWGDSLPPPTMVFTSHWLRLLSLNDESILLPPHVVLTVVLLYFGLRIRPCCNLNTDER